MSWIQIQGFDDQKIEEKIGEKMHLFYQKLQFTVLIPRLSYRTSKLQERLHPVEENIQHFTLKLI